MPLKNPRWRKPFHASGELVKCLDLNPLFQQVVQCFCLILGNLPQRINQQKTAEFRATETKAWICIVDDCSSVKSQLHKT